MSQLFSQFFQRGRGTAPLLRPRPPAPFDTGGPLAEIEAGTGEPDVQTDYRTTAPAQWSAEPASQAAIVPPVPAEGRSDRARVPNPPTMTGADKIGMERPVLANAIITPASAAAPLGTHPKIRHPLNIPRGNENVPPAAVATIHVDASSAVAQPRRRSAAPYAPVAGSANIASGAAPDSDSGVALTSTPVTMRPSQNQIRAGMIDIVNAPSALAKPAAPAAISQPQETQTLFGSTAAAPMLSFGAAPGTAGRIAGQSIAPAAPGQRVTLAAAAPPEQNSAAPLSRQAASATNDAPRIEVRIGRIDIQVPPATREPEQRSTAIGMSLDAFIAETRQ